MKTCHVISAMHTLQCKLDLDNLMNEYYFLYLFNGERKLKVKRRLNL